MNGASPSLDMSSPQGQRSAGVVIPNQDSLIGDLLSLDLSTPTGQHTPGFTMGLGVAVPTASAGQDLLGADLDNLVMNNWHLSRRVIGVLYTGYIFSWAHPNQHQPPLSDIVRYPHQAVELLVMGWDPDWQI